MEATLTPGDCLYLPRGFIHSATALGGTSIHLTFGIHAVTEAQIVAAMLEQVQNGDWRESMPVGWDPTDGTEYLAPILERLRLRIDAVDLDAVGRDLRHRQGSQQRPEPLSPVAQADAAAHLQPHHVVRLRRFWDVQLTDTDLRLPNGRTVTLSRADLSAVRSLMTGHPVRVQDLACDPATIAGLLREGVLMDRDGPVSIAGFRCSTASALRQDSMVATAPPGQRWLLVEREGAWPSRALDVFDPFEAHALSQKASAYEARISLIRRPGRHPRTQGPFRWAIADIRPGHEGIRWNLGESLEEVLADNWHVEPGGDPVAIVCAHSKHDVCCALRGRPVAAAVELMWPGQVWECSHLGGDRFAATMVLLLHGLSFGRVDVDSGSGDSRRLPPGGGAQRPPARPQRLRTTRAGSRHSGPAGIGSHEDRRPAPGQCQRSGSRGGGCLQPA